MNERIEKLSDQARQCFRAQQCVDRAFLEKFAQLIVRECADICINENVSNLDLEVMRESGKFTVQDLATKSCGENLSKRIKEHFGVEL